MDDKSLVNDLLNNSTNYSLMDTLIKEMSFDQKKALFEELKAPKIHGDYKSEYVLVPLCSFGTQEMENCTTFENADTFYKKDQICHTFNKNGTMKGQSIIPYTGLNFVVNYGFPVHGDIYPVTLVIHPPNVLPDLDNFQRTSITLPEQTQTYVGIEPTITNVTRGFAALSPNQTKCFLDTDTYKLNGYKRINCKMEKALSSAKQKCGCVPWFFEINENDTICNPDTLACFDKEMTKYAHNHLSDECPQECIFSRYNSVRFNQQNIRSLKVIQMIENDFGTEMKEFLGENNPSSFILYGTLLEKAALVHVNFDTPEAAVTIKDAKMTFADKVGNIGGTFGVFLGLSFVGILEFGISILKWTKKIIKF